MHYDQFCAHLESAVINKGIGATSEDIRNTAFPFVDVLARYKQGLCSLADAEHAFITAVHRHMRRGRIIAEAGQ